LLLLVFYFFFLLMFCFFSVFSLRFERRGVVNSFTNYFSSSDDTLVL